MGAGQREGNTLHRRSALNGACAGLPPPHCTAPVRPDACTQAPENTIGRDDKGQR